MGDLDLNFFFVIINIVLGDFMIGINWKCFMYFCWLEKLYIGRFKFVLELIDIFMFFLVFFCEGLLFLFKV